MCPKLKNGQEPRTQTQKQDGVVVGVRARKLKKQDGARKAMDYNSKKDWSKMAVGWAFDLLSMYFVRLGCIWLKRIETRWRWRASQILRRVVWTYAASSNVVRCLSSQLCLSWPRRSCICPHNSPQNLGCTPTPSCFDRLIIYTLTYLTSRKPNRRPSWINPFYYYNP